MQTNVQKQQEISSNRNGTTGKPNGRGADSLRGADATRHEDPRFMRGSQGAFPGEGSYREWTVETHNMGRTDKTVPLPAPRDQAQTNSGLIKVPSVSTRRSAVLAHSIKLHGGTAIGEIPTYNRGPTNETGGGAELEEGEADRSEPVAGTSDAECTERVLPGTENARRSWAAAVLQVLSVLVIAFILYACIAYHQSWGLHLDWCKEVVDRFITQLTVCHVHPDRAVRGQTSVRLGPFEWSFDQESKDYREFGRRLWSCYSTKIGWLVSRYFDRLVLLSIIVLVFISAALITRLLLKFVWWFFYDVTYVTLLRAKDKFVYAFKQQGVKVLYADPIPDVSIQKGDIKTGGKALDEPIAEEKRDFVPEVVLGNVIELATWPNGVVRIVERALSPDESLITVRTLGTAFFLKCHGKVYFIMTYHQACDIQKLGTDGVWIHGPAGVVSFPNHMKVVFRGNNRKTDFCILEPSRDLQSRLGVKALEPMLLGYHQCFASVSSYDEEKGKWFVDYKRATVPDHSNIISHTCSTWNGSSGSPLMVRVGSSWKVIGVHIGGNPSSAINFAASLQWFYIKTPEEWLAFRKGMMKESEGRWYNNYIPEDPTFYDIFDSYDSQFDIYEIDSHDSNDNDAFDIAREKDESRHRGWYYDDSEEVVIPKQYDDDDIAAMDQAIDDYAHEPTDANRGNIRRLAIQKETAKKQDFGSSPAGAGVPQEQISPQELALKALTESVRELHAKWENSLSSNQSKGPVKPSEPPKSDKSEPQRPTKALPNPPKAKANGSSKRKQKKEGSGKSSKPGGGPKGEQQRK